MNWSEFKGVLKENEALILAFEYAAGERVHPSFHLTEIKQAPIISVDCGGAVNGWTEVILQLWEPEDLQDSAGMPVKKALSIIELVESKIALNPAATVKVEYGNADFPTRQMLPSSLEVVGGELLVRLEAEQTQCKALSRGQTCGTPKPKVKLALVGTEGATCTPGSGCC
jgi:hypothetical protein